MSPRSSIERERSEDRIAEEAALWAQRLGDQPDPEDPIPDPTQRQAAFFAWFERSPAHVRALFEVLRVMQILPNAAPALLDEIRERFRQNGFENVVELRPGVEYRPAVVDKRVPVPTIASPRPTHHRTWLVALAASVTTAAIAALVAYGLTDRTTYSTAVGEQRSVALEDGSVVLLNTDSQMRVNFSAGERLIELVRGEALFTVQHNSSRPFVVHTAGATVRAVGTQFDVRRATDSTEVTVVEGVVRVVALESPAAAVPSTGSSVPQPVVPIAEIGAGNAVKVEHGTVGTPGKALASALAWQKRRLIFTDAPLSEVAGEFNRYNKVQIRVEGDAARKHISGVFDADRPTVVLQYTMRDDSLVVEPQGNSWVIRPR